MGPQTAWEQHGLSEVRIPFVVRGQFCDSEQRLLLTGALRKKRENFLLRKMHYMPNLTCPFLIFFYSCVFPIQLLTFLSLFLPLSSSYPCFLFPCKSYCCILKESPLKKKSFFFLNFLKVSYQAL